MAATPIAIIKTSRADMAPKTSPKGWSRIVIERADNGGGTVQVFSDGNGDMPFGGKPKTMSFESPESLSAFVTDQVTQAPVGSKGPSSTPPPGPEQVPEGGPGPNSPDDSAMDGQPEPDEDDQ